MTITKRTLERWRKEALQIVNATERYEAMLVNVVEMNKRIIRLTQILLDQHLMKERKS